MPPTFCLLSVNYQENVRLVLDTLVYQIFPNHLTRYPVCAIIISLKTSNNKRLHSNKIVL